MKRFHVKAVLAGLLLLLPLISSARLTPAAQAATLPAVRIFVDGRELASDVEPVIVSDRVLIPMRTVFEALGAKVEWDPALRQVIATRGGTLLALTIDSPEAQVNGLPQHLDVPPLIIQGRTMVPLRFAAEALDATVQWAPLTRSVWVWSQQAETTPATDAFRQLLTDLHWIVYSPVPPSPGSDAASQVDAIRRDLALLRGHGFDGLILRTGAGLHAGIPLLAQQMGFSATIIAIDLTLDRTGQLDAGAWRSLTSALVDRQSVIGFAVGQQGPGAEHRDDMLQEVMANLRASGRRVTTIEALSRLDDASVGSLGDWLFPIALPWDAGIREPDLAAEWVSQQVDALTRRYPGQPMLVATGFPTGDDPQASEIAQATFYKALQARGLPAAWDEAFDDSVSASLRRGLFDVDRRPKAATQLAPKPEYVLSGLAFSPYRGSQDPNRGAHVSPAQLLQRLWVIAPATRWVRTYGTTNGLERAGSLARALGLNIAMGAWLGRDRAANDREIANLVAAAKAGEVDVAVVGSEVLLRGDLTEDELLGYMDQVRKQVPDLKVTTAEVYGVLLSHPRILHAVDLVYAHIYPFWEGVPVNQAIGSVHNRYQQLVAAAGGKAVVVAETGWPSGGEPVGEAVPSPENAAAYFLSFVSWARANSVPYYYFEALDERWKAAYEGDRGANWGVWDESGQLKPGMEAVFAGAVAPDTWSDTLLVDGEGTPAITFTSVPPYGSFELLVGKVSHVVPRDYRVAVYIQVNGGWWTKPTWDEPLVVIRPDGNWSTRIVTGGNDRYATRVAAFLLPVDSNPPLRRGEVSLPPELLTAAVAHVEAVRNP